MYFRVFDEPHDRKQHCYHIKSKEKKLSNGDIDFIFSILKIKNQEPTKADIYPSVSKEVGFHFNYESPWCSNVLAIFRKNGVNSIERIERTTIIHNDIFDPDRIDPKLHRIYETSPNTFDVEVPRTHTEIISYDKIAEFSKQHNLAFDQQDIAYYTNLFQNIMERNPTSMELVDLAQSNSEHSRHWFFNGIMNIGFIKETKTLMDYIKEPLACNRQNSVVAFSDNASAINTSGPVIDLLPSDPTKTSKFVRREIKYYPTLNAETHNFPTGISPFPGAATGVGGRIRDTHAIGRGGIISAGLAGYCVGNLFIDEPVPWETTDPSNQTINATKMLLEASDGASDYGNKFGEPLIGGFCRSFGMDISCAYREELLTTPGVEHFEYIKPIMFSAGIGKIPEPSLFKRDGAVGMGIYKIGGPAYRIGIGGGSASSRPQDAAIDDMNSVQRGDPEMENRMNRFVRACSELGDENPIVKIHDQGAGGMANVTKEIIEPFGSTVNITNVHVGDKTMTPFEIWNAEYQEQSTILVEPRHESLIYEIAARENVPIAKIGTLDNSDKIRVVDKHGQTHVDLNLSDVLTNKRRKEYFLKPRETIYLDVRVPTQKEQACNFTNDLKNIFSLVSVGSKSFLTQKVDRTVGGLVVQQQCVGPLDIPLCDYGMTKHSFFSDLATITAVGEQPIKGIVDPIAMVGMSIGEMLTNIMWGVIPDIDHIKCSGNWMWPNTDPYEQYLLYESVKETSRVMRNLGIAIDGGKDSLSMSVNTADGTTVKSPRSFVVTGYAEAQDYRKRVTPDLKKHGSVLIYINLSNDNYRIGGSAYAQTRSCLGDKSQIPRFENQINFASAFRTIQDLISEGIILSGHDVSDGGLITAILEMCFTGNLGCELDIKAEHPLYNFMFSEELGVVVEVESKYVQYVVDVMCHVSKPYVLGIVRKLDYLTITYNEIGVLKGSMTDYRGYWEATSIKLIRKQFGERYARRYSDKIHSFIHSNDNFNLDMKTISFPSQRPNVAILRDEGTTGDREMAAAFYAAGFQPWDVTREEYASAFNRIGFKVTALCGGFTYSDVLGGGTGFKTGLELRGLQLGICNGCQMRLNVDVNESGRLESDMVWINGDKAELFDIEGRHKCITVNKRGRLKEIDNQKMIATDDKYVGKQLPQGLFMMPHIERMIRHEAVESGWIRIFLNFHKYIQK